MMLDRVLLGPPPPIHLGPNILMFSDNGWDGTRTEAQEARQEQYMGQVLRPREDVWQVIC